MLGKWPQEESCHKLLDSVPVAMNRAWELQGVGPATCYHTHKIQHKRRKKNKKASKSNNATLNTGWKV